jgi:uncharacterized SAM-binding protein YcdF (DUF218 family)
LKGITQRYRVVLILLALLCVLGTAWVVYVQLKIAGAEHDKFQGTADVGIVLGAALWKDIPSPGLRERLDHALELYNAGMFRIIIVSGGMDSNGATIPEAEGMKRYLMRKGVLENVLFTENKSRNTLENLRFSQTIMQEHGWKHAVIVTHDFHGARAKDMAGFLGYDRPALSVCKSRVLNTYWHHARETLAYTKWMIDKLRM